MSIFDAALAASGAIHDTVYGESILVEPRAKSDPNGRSNADLTRAATTITAVWTEPHADVAPTNKTGHPAAEGYHFDTSKPSIDFEVAALPYSLAIGDFATRVKTGTRYAVAAHGDDGFTRATAQLTSARGRT